MPPLSISPGERFGRLIAVSVHPERAKDRQVRWVCRGDCGNESIVVAGCLKSGGTTSCGCYQIAQRFAKAKNVVGQQFNALLILRDVPYVEGQERHVICRCDCGQEVEVRLYNLKNNHTTSCGCVGRANAIAASTIHGRTGTPEYKVWDAMRRRCNCPTDTGYPNYGGRGIKVCERWQDSFENFFADMDERPSLKHSIERRDVNGDYTPGNCIWATRTEQARNTRFNRLLTLGDRTQCLAAWAEEAGLTSARLWRRLNEGWSLEEAISTPNMHHSRVNAKPRG